MAYSFPHTMGLATPAFEIWLDGKEIPEAYYDLVEDITYESHDSGADIATIFIHDPELKIIDDPRLIKGMEVKIFGGWKTDLVEWLSGYVALIDIEFPEKAVPTLTLHCMDESFLLDRMEVKFNYSNMTFSQIVKQVAARYGMKTKGKDTTHVYDSVSQANETDMKFLLRLAESDKEYLCLKVKNKTIMWMDKEEKFESQDTFTWRNVPFNLKSFAPRIVVSDRKDGVEESDIDDKSKKIDSGVADNNTNRSSYGNSTMADWKFDTNSGLWRKG